MTTLVERAESLYRLASDLPDSRDTVSLTLTAPASLTKNITGGLEIELAWMRAEDPLASGSAFIARDVLVYAADGAGAMIDIHLDRLLRQMEDMIRDKGGAECS